MIVLAVNSLRVLGGGEKWLVRHSPLWSRRGVELRIACQPGSPLQALAGRRGVAVEPVRMRHDLSPFAVMGLARVIRRLRPGAILCCNERAYRLAAPAARLCGGPPLVYRNGLTGTFKNKAHNRLLSPGLARIVAVSDDLRAEMAGISWLGPGRLDTIHNGIDPAPYAADPARRAAIRSELGAGPESVVFAVAARLTEDKGVGDTLAAFAELAGRRPRSVLWLAGEGPLRAELEERASRLNLGRQVRFLGFREDIAAVLQGVDVFVQASHREGLGNAILEAMASGCAVVASRAGGNPELVAHGETGFLVPVRDLTALAAALERLAEDEPARRRMGEAGRVRAASEFPLEREADRWVALLRQVARPVP